MPESRAVRGDDAALIGGRRAAAAGPPRPPGGTAGVVAAVSAGGAIGAMARHALTLAFPASPGAFPWTLFAVNVGGCLLIGVLMAALGEGRGARPLLRPFLGTGVLGGFTTFSAFVYDVRLLLDAGRPGIALGYLAATLAAGLAAVALAVRVTRLVLRRGRAAG